MEKPDRPAATSRPDASTPAPRENKAGARSIGGSRLRTSVLVYDGPRWIGVYERWEPPQELSTPRGTAEVWVVLE